MTQMPPQETSLRFFMKAENEFSRLAQSCARWAAETQDRNVRDAFMAMAKEWSRLGLQQITDE